MARLLRRAKATGVRCGQGEEVAAAGKEAKKENRGKKRCYRSCADGQKQVIRLQKNMKGKNEEVEKKTRARAVERTRR